MRRALPHLFLDEVANLSRNAQTRLHEELPDLGERVYVCDRYRSIQASELPLEVTTTEPIRGSFTQRVRALEKALLRNALEDAGGNQRAAAQQLGMTYDQFRHQYRKYGLGSSA